MTDYTNNRYIQHQKEYLQNIDWYAGQVIKLAGTIPLATQPKKNMYLQFDTLYAKGANIKKSDTREYPQGVLTEMKSLTRKAKWFTGMLEWSDLEHEDYVAGNIDAVAETNAKIDNINYQHDVDLETWFVGYDTTFTSDPDYDDKWVPWMKLQSTATSDPSNPGDMNDKVTNIAGTTGTTATELDMTTVLRSTTTNMTMNFADHTFGPILRAFNLFEDSYNGRRMVSFQEKFGQFKEYELHVHPAVINELYRAPVYDGEKILTNYSVGKSIEEMGISIVPNRHFSYALAEEAGGGEGKIQFGITANFNRNFKIGYMDKMKWEADLEIPGRNTKWLKKMNERLVPFTMPYYDGSKWYKPFFAGYFTFMNDA